MNYRQIKNIYMAVLYCGYHIAYTDGYIHVLHPDSNDEWILLEDRWELVDDNYTLEKSNDR